MGQLAPLADPALRGVTVIRKRSTEPGLRPPLELRSLDALRGHDTLVEVDLSWESEVDDISAVASLPRLESLLLARVKGDLSPLQHCKALRRLSLYSERLVDLTPILPLAERLERLDISWSPLADLTGLDRFKRLRHLSLSMTPVAALVLPPSLESIVLGHMEVLADLGPLAACPALEKVTLSNFTCAAAPEPLWGLPLKELLLDGLPGLDDDALAGLQRLTGLRELSLEPAGIRSLRMIEGLSELRSLRLHGCPELNNAEVCRVARMLPKLESLSCDGSKRSLRSLRRSLPRVSVNNEPPLSPPVPA